MLMEPQCDDADDTFTFPFHDLPVIEEKQQNQKRRICQRCGRPERVCVCASFPAERVNISTFIHILQHPREQDFRQLTTVPLLCECLVKDKCIIYRGRRFSQQKFPHLHNICALENTILLYPSPDAITIEEYLQESRAEDDINMIVLDGTWREAKSIYFNCKMLHTLRKVKLVGTWKSEFVIKTQPNNDGLSTCEAVAIAIGQIENKLDLIQVVRKPLKSLCDIQLEHGAQVHQSKEELASMGIKYRVYPRPF